MDGVTEALLEAASELRRPPKEAELAGLLRLFTHFAAAQPPAIDSVLSADGPLWALHALVRFPDSTASEVAVKLLQALGRAGAALGGPLAPPWPSSDANVAQKLSPELRAARARAARRAAAGPAVIVSSHCGALEPSPARLAALNAVPELVSELTRRCELETEPPLVGLTIRSVPPTDPRPGLAGAGSAVYSTQQWSRHSVLGAYSGWLTHRDEFDETVPLLERCPAEARAVTTTSTVRVRLRGSTWVKRRLMCVAYPESATHALSQLNDWRCVDADGIPSAPPGKDGAAAHCELLEVIHCGWPFLFVVTTREVSSGEELCVQYPDEFWKGRVAALRAHSVAEAAVSGGGKGEKRRKRTRQDGA